MKHTITKTHWAKMKHFANATQTTGVVKQGERGGLYEWVTSGKRVTVREIRVDQIPTEAFASPEQPRIINGFGNTTIVITPVR